MARRQVTCTVTLLCALALSLRGESAVLAQEARPPSADPAVAAPESVMAPLQRALAWYQEARVVMQGLRNVLDADFDRGEEQTAQRAVQRAFDAARGRAAILGQTGAAGGQEGSAPRSTARADRRAELRATIEREERDIARLPPKRGPRRAPRAPGSTGSSPPRRTVSISADSSWTSRRSCPRSMSRRPTIPRSCRTRSRPCATPCRS
jgi:hypothetical protein